VGGNAIIKDYDILGNEVAIHVDEYKPAGVYEVEFSSIGGASFLSSGVYYYQLKADKHLETKKMTLIK
jgi:hypothetical protein